MNAVGGFAKVLGCEAPQKKFRVFTSEQRCIVLPLLQYISLFYGKFNTKLKNVRKQNLNQEVLHCKIYRN